VGLFRALVIGLFILAVPVALITTNIRVALSDQRAYDHAVQSYDAAEASGIQESELLRANGEIKRYLTSDVGRPLAIEVRNERGEIETLFTARETAHMADVRGLVRALFAAQVASVFAVLTVAIVLTMWSPRLLAKAALRGALLTGGILLGAGIVAASGFDSAWTQFHQLAFSNDFWALDPRTDHLIQMFPEAFWQEITILIVMATLLESFLMVGASMAYLLLTRPQEGELIELPARAIAGSAGQSAPKLATPKPRHFFR
jgi:integral membrane protein (TIGR01906 family)